MGETNSKQGPPKVDIDDQIFQIRWQAKQFESQSKRSEKEKEKEMVKAKKALQKGNEEGARLFLANAANKQKESINLLKMSQKLDAVSTTIKMNRQNQQMVQQLTQLTPVLNQQTQNVPFEQIYSNISQFDEAMDKILVQNKIMNEMVNKNDSQDMAVDQLFDMLKKEHMNEIANEINVNPFQNNQFVNVQQQNNQMFQQLQNPQQVQKNNLNQNIQN